MSSSDEAPLEGALPVTAIFALAPVGIALTDAATSPRIVQANRALARWLGYDREDLGGRLLVELIHAHDVAAATRLFAEIWHEPRRTQKCELLFRQRDDTPMWGRLTLVKLRDPNGLPLRCLAFAENLNEQREAADRLLAEERLLRQLLALQDRERRLVSYEIHDGLVQDLVGTHLLLQAVRGQIESGQEAPSLADFTRAQDALARAINEGRRLISELRPMIVDQLGIVEAIQYVVDEFEAWGEFVVQFTHRGDFGPMLALLEGTICRIVQEALNNVRRHAQAHTVQIRLTELDHQFVVLEIQDDGRGFNVNQVPKDRFGLESIRERARLFGGGATVESQPGGGTRITVKLPKQLPTDSEPRTNPRPEWTI